MKISWEKKKEKISGVDQRKCVEMDFFQLRICKESLCH